MPGWKRKREDQGAERPPASPEVDRVQAADRLGDSPIDLTDGTGAARYSAWADRMRDKRDRNQAEILGGRQEAATDNWSAASVLGTGDEDRPLGDPSGPDAWETARALEVLGLDALAGTSDLAAAFRALAKIHHPDRWAQADEPLRREHAEAMLRINAAYQALRGAASVS